jgi:site-specific recombinase XerD
MSYSIKVFLHNYKDNAGLQKITIRITCNRKHYYTETPFKVKAEQFVDGIIKKHPQAAGINSLLRKQITDIEKKIIDAMQNEILNEKRIIEIVKGKEPGVKTSIDDYKDKLIEQVTGKVSDNRIRHIRSVVNKFTRWNPKLTFNDININVLNDFEAHIRKSGSSGEPRRTLDGNTVFGNMKLLKAFLIKANIAGLIKEEQYKAYKVPSYKQKLPVYLTEAEIDDIHTAVKSIKIPGMKTVGYYFLLSCFAGYRISDLMQFDYDKAVHGNNLTLRAKKNGQIVSIDIYFKLEMILEYIKDHKLNISEQHFRKYVKHIVFLCNIKKDVTPHTGRHSFAMMLMNKGFTIDEVAELLGDSELIAKVYARITNEHLNKKVKERLN